jgi:putative alpha-1,2-mannosidase
MGGGTLKLKMGDQPNKNWGTDYGWYQEELDRMGLGN